MARFLVRRLLFSLVVLLLVSAAIFLLTRLVPGSPALIYLSADATEAQVLEFERAHGLDRPLAVQYLSWIGNVVLRGDFGRSYITQLSISAEVMQTLPITMEIVGLAFIFCVSVSIPLGIVSALYEGRFVDHVARIVAIVGVSVPNFWLGLVLISFVAVQLRLLPPGEYVPPSAGLREHFASVALPAFTLGVHYMALISRITRSSMLDVLSKDYVRTATAMGLSRSRVLAYAIKNALIPVVSVCAMSIGYMIGWSVVIEQVFNIAGLSRTLLSAIFQRDYLMVQAVVLVITTVFVASNTIADVLYRVLNPKIR